MENITLENLEIIKKRHNKIIVTGPPRSGTTISGLIIAKELKWKFIDESWYDGNNAAKLMFFLMLDRNLVIHTTAFLRDLHTIKKFLDNHKIGIILVKRKIEDIIESFENSKRFTIPVHTSVGLFMSIDDEAKRKMLAHYGYENGCIPEIIYNHFYNNNDEFYEINYDDLSKHKLFVQKEVRRKKFKHIKQVDADDPYYLKNQKGIMVL